MDNADYSHSSLTRVALLASLLGACATPEKLNSDRIREQFGNYGVEVVSQDAKIRRSSLYSTANETRTARTEAIVIFSNPIAPTLAEVHEEVIAGASIGEAFRNDDWQVLKKTAYLGEIGIDEMHSPVTLRMRLAVPATLAMHVYELHLKQGRENLHYATVIEVHHPEYLSPRQLHEIYSSDAATQLPIHDVRLLSELVLSGH